MRALNGQQFWKTEGFVPKKEIHSIETPFLWLTPIALSAFFIVYKRLFPYYESRGAWRYKDELFQSRDTETNFENPMKPSEL